MNVEVCKDHWTSAKKTLPPWRPRITNSVIPQNMGCRSDDHVLRCRGSLIAKCQFTARPVAVHGLPAAPAAIKRDMCTDSSSLARSQCSRPANPGTAAHARGVTTGPRPVGVVGSSRARLCRRRRETVRLVVIRPARTPSYRTIGAAAKGTGKHSNQNTEICTY